MKSTVLSLGAAVLFSFSLLGSTTDSVLVHNWSEEMIQTFNEGNIQIMSEMFDFDVFGQRLASHAPENAASILMIMPMIKERFPLATKISEVVDNGGDYAYLHSYIDEEGAPHAVFRLITEDLGINYHDYLMSVKEEEVKVNDIYVYMTGEYLSETMGVVMGLAMQSPESSSESANSFREGMNTIQLAMRNLAMGDHKRAATMIEGMSGMITETSIYKTAYREVMGVARPEQFQEELEFQHSHRDSIPDDELLTGISFWIVQEESGKLNDVLDELERRLGGDGDPFLNIHRATAAMGDKDWTKAEALINDYINRDSAPFYGELYLIYLNIERGALSKACTAYENFLTTYGLSPFTGEAILDNYPSFVKSEVYQKWFVEYTEREFPQGK